MYDIDCNSRKIYEWYSVEQAKSPCTGNEDVKRRRGKSDQSPRSREKTAQAIQIHMRRDGELMSATD